MSKSNDNSRLLPTAQAEMRKRHLARSTEKSYLAWIVRYIRFHDMQHPSELGPEAIEQFLSSLALNKNLSPSSQNQALNAVVFLYQKVLHQDPGEFGSFTRAKTVERLPEVFTPEEIAAIFSHLTGT